MRNIYERVIGPAQSKKHEFIYADGYPVREGKPIWAVYTKQDKLEVFVDVNEVPVFTRDKQKKTLFGKYKMANSNFQRELYLKAFKPIITTSNRANGTIGRGFARYVLDPHKSIFEIKPELINIPTSLYEKVILQWTISGEKQNVRNSNRIELVRADKEFTGIINFLNPLEFYIGEETLESKKQTLLERLLHNPHTYTHQSDASNVGSALGLSGTHTMPDGSVMPGATHQQYLNSLRRNDEITTSSGTSIPTQNLRRNSGY
tara:strand:- start:219 stop:1001 length:783 start_codon:yes stop_codon:yes gene_type:complete